MHAVYRSQLSRGHQGVLPAAVGARPSAPVRGDGVGTGAGLAGGESAGPGTVGAVLTDPLVQSPGAGAGTMLAVPREVPRRQGLNLRWLPDRRPTRAPRQTWSATGWSSLVHAGATQHPCFIHARVRIPRVANLVGAEAVLKLRVLRSQPRLRCVLGLPRRGSTSGTTPGDTLME